MNRSNLESSGDLMMDLACHLSVHVSVLILFPELEINDCYLTLVIINDGPHSANGSTEWVSRFPNRGVSSTTKMKNSKMEIRDLILNLCFFFLIYLFSLGLFLVRKKRKMGVITSLDESDQEQPTE
jgi:hypothetical protein